jgi:hypothetical protein
VIDFRYHLVSLISVFLALAVGIVLGAGPLRENLGDQLTGQVEQLRTEQDELRAQAEELAAQRDQLSTLVTELGPELVAETLPEAEVAVVSDHGSTRTQVDRVQSLLGDAGAASAVEVELLPALWEPGQEERRTQALEEIRGLAPEVLDGDLEVEQQLPATVIALLTSTAGPDGQQLGPALRSELWQVLVDQQLVSLPDGEPSTIDGVIVAGADPAEHIVDSDDDDLAAARAQGLLLAQTAVLDALAGAELPTVVSAVTPVNDGTQGMLRTVRGDSTYRDLSTTDRLQEPDGPMLSVLALVEQVRGGSGAYGTTADAEARLPELPETEDVVLPEGPEGGEDSGAPEDPEAPDGEPSDGGGEG